MYTYLYSHSAEKTLSITIRRKKYSYAECPVLFIVMLNIVALSVIMINAFVVSVVLLSVMYTHTHTHTHTHIYIYMTDDISA